MASWHVVQVTVRGGFFAEPELLFDAGISDHAPTCFVLSPKPLQTIDHAIPHFVARSTAFKQHLVNLTHYSKLDHLTPIVRWSTHKTCIKEAARRTIRDLHHLQPNHRITQSLALSHISRVVRQQDVARARTLLRKCHHARHHIHIDPLSNAVRLNSSARFSLAFETAMR